MKFLSVVMPSYNQIHYLNERLQSILKEIDDEDEIVIIDDCSTDGSYELSQEFAQRDPRVKLIHNDMNKGVHFSVTLGAKYAVGEYLFMIAVDDICLPGAIQRVKNCIKVFGNVDICSSEFVQLDEALLVPKLTTSKLVPDVSGPQFFSAQQTRKLLSRGVFWVPGHTVTVKKSLFFQYGAFNPSYGPYVDWLMFHTIAMDRGILYIPEPLFVWRSSATNYSKNANNSPFQQAIFKDLTTDRKIKKYFIESDIMRVMVRQQLFWLVRCPSYWIFLWNTLYRGIGRKLCKLFVKTGVI